MSETHGTIASVDFTPKKSDAEAAAELRARLADAMKPVIAIQEEGRLRGLEVSFNLGRDSIGRWCLAVINIYRIL